MPAVVMELTGVSTSARPSARTIFGIGNWSPAVSNERYMFMKTTEREQMPTKAM